MPKTNFSLQDLQEALSAERTLYFRALIRKVDNEWRVYTLRVDNLPSSRKIKPEMLNYGEIAFVFGRTSGHQVFQWLENKLISFDGQKYIIPDFQSNIRVDRYPSGKERFWIKLPYPFSIYELNHSDRDAIREDYEPLIKKGLPSFPSVVASAYYYLFETEYRPDRKVPDILMFCIGHRECWIEKIHLRLSSVKVQVNGTKAKGTRLEIRAGMNHYETILQKSGTKVISLPEGLPESLWLMLSRDGQWLDYRELNLSGNYWMDRNDVVNESMDKSTEIKGIIIRGEGETTEFKIKVPTDKDSTKNLVKTIAAFANGNGGILVVGVEDKTGRIVGVQGNVDQEKLRLAQMLRTKLVPQPNFKIDTQKVDQVYLFIVTVESGTNHPYGIEPDNPRYFVRRGATTFPAAQEEIRALAQKGRVSAFDY